MINQERERKIHLLSIMYSETGKEFDAFEVTESQIKSVYKRSMLKVHPNKRRPNEREEYTRISGELSGGLGDVVAMAMVNRDNKGKMAFQIEVDINMYLYDKDKNKLVRKLQKYKSEGKIGRGALSLSGVRDLLRNRELSANLLNQTPVNNQNQSNQERRQREQNETRRRANQEQRERNEARRRANQEQRQREQNEARRRANPEQRQTEQNENLSNAFATLGIFGANNRRTLTGRNLKNAYNSTITVSRAGRKSEINAAFDRIKAGRGFNVSRNNTGQHAENLSNAYRTLSIPISRARNLTGQRLKNAYNSSISVSRAGRKPEINAAFDKIKRVRGFTVNRNNTGDRQRQQRRQQNSNTQSQKNAERERERREQRNRLVAAFTKLGYSTNSINTRTMRLYNIHKRFMNIKNDYNSKSAYELVKREIIQKQGFNKVMREFEENKKKAEKTNLKDAYAYFGYKVSSMSNYITPLKLMKDWQRKRAQPMSSRQSEELNIKYQLILQYIRSRWPEKTNDPNGNENEIKRFGLLMRGKILKLNSNNFVRNFKKIIEEYQDFFPYSNMSDILSDRIIKKHLTKTISEYYSKMNGSARTKKENLRLFVKYLEELEISRFMNSIKPKIIKHIDAGNF
jgi:hypothetical protein